MRRQPDACDPNEFEGRELDWDAHLRLRDGWPERIGFGLGLGSVYLFAALCLAIVVLAGLGLVELARQAIARYVGG